MLRRVPLRVVRFRQIQQRFDPGPASFRLFWLVVGDAKPLLLACGERRTFGQL